MPEDVLLKVLSVVTEHTETLRGTEVHIWYPDNDKVTEGMLRVLNSGYENRQSYNFDSKPSDYSHDNLYRFHDCELFITLTIFLLPCCIVEITRWFSCPNILSSSTHNSAPEICRVE